MPFEGRKLTRLAGVRGSERGREAEGERRGNNDDLDVSTLFGDDHKSQTFANEQNDDDLDTNSLFRDDKLEEKPQPSASEQKCNADNNTTSTESQRHDPDASKKIPGFNSKDASVAASEGPEHRFEGSWTPIDHKKGQSTTFRSSGRTCIPGGHAAIGALALPKAPVCSQRKPVFPALGVPGAFPEHPVLPIGSSKLQEKQKAPKSDTMGHTVYAAPGFRTRASCCSAKAQ